MSSAAPSTPPSDPSDAPATPEVAGRIHSYETGAAVDGPGVRFVVFTQGCLMRCKYCHNPDTWDTGGGRRVTASEVMDLMRPYAFLMKRSGGGVTCSGGEPLFQHAFVHEIFRRARAELGVNTVLDTQGFLHRKTTDAWWDEVDLTLLDIKHIRPGPYRELTGVDMAPTLECARRLAALGKRMWIRYVLVPGINDDPAIVAEHADFVASLGPAVERVEVLPFHKLGEHKWKELGLRYELTDTRPPTNEVLARTLDIYRSRGLEAPGFG